MTLAGVSTPGPKALIPMLTVTAPAGCALPCGNCVRSMRRRMRSPMTTASDRLVCGSSTQNSSPP
jgi:hypothetical protein